MASLKARLDRLEARYGSGTFEDMVRRMPTEDLEVLASLYARVNAGQADEAIVAQIRHIESRNR